MDPNIANEFERTDSSIASQRDAPSGEIAFATGMSTLGTVLVARSARGVCAILIGSEDRELVADLAARFPENRLVPGQRKVEGELKKILRFIENPAADLALELDIYGTPFSQARARTIATQETFPRCKKSLSTIIPSSPISGGGAGVKDVVRSSDLASVSCAQDTAKGIRRSRTKKGVA